MNDVLDCLAHAAGTRDPAVESFAGTYPEMSNKHLLTAYKYAIVEHIHHLDRRDPLLRGVTMQVCVFSMGSAGYWPVYIVCRVLSISSYSIYI